MSGVARVDGGPLGPLEAASIPVTDPGFTHGWTVFETFQAHGRLPATFDEHMERLARSAAVALVPLPRRDALREEATDVVSRFDGPVRVRITLTAGGHRVVQGVPAEAARWHGPVRAARGTWRDEPYLGGAVKHGSRAPWLVAVRRSGADEVLLVDEQGRFTEGTACAVLAIIGGTLWTAPHDGRILQSTTINDLVRRATALGIPVKREGPPAAGPWDGLYVASVTRDLSPVVELDGQDIPSWDRLGRALAATRGDVMRVGLEVLLADRLDLVKGARVGLLCNHTAVDLHLRHAVDLLRGAGVDLVRLFAPEHGVRATVQDMIGLDEARDPVSGLPVVSLYTHDAASLRPKPESLADLDAIVFDIQDVGSRYYTYQATLGFVMQAAGPLGKRVIVLDRPNPITGATVEGNVVNPGYESFVGAFPLAVRHGMTVGELARYFRAWCGIDCDVEVVACDGWSRRDWYDGRPWVFPSPNMPTVDTATVYPGTCLVEGTNLSEGRGTTRPFHLVGAPWLDPQAFAAECTRLAGVEGLEGVLFRPHAFLPGFQKHAGKQCGGVEIHVVDRDRLHALLLGMIVIAAARNVDPEHFAWRTSTYEFVEKPIAIDLLTGSSEYRETVDSGGSLRALIDAWEPQRRGFLVRREGCLLYS